MSSFTPQSKSSAPSYTTQTKNVATFITEIRHGKTATFDQIGDRPMDNTNEVFDQQALQTNTFDQLSDQQWSTQTKH